MSGSPITQNMSKKEYETKNNYYYLNKIMSKILRPFYDIIAESRCLQRRRCWKSGGLLNKGINYHI